MLESPTSSIPATNYCLPRRSTSVVIIVSRPGRLSYGPLFRLNCCRDNTTRRHVYVDGTSVVCVVRRASLVARRYLSLLHLVADVAANVRPRHEVRPPDGPELRLAPRRLAAAGRVLQHLGDEGAQLGLQTERGRRRSLRAVTQVTAAVTTCCLSSSLRTSLRTFAHGTSIGHQIGR